MTIDPTLVAQINTPVKGTDGQTANSPAGPPPGSPGPNGGKGLPGIDPISNDSFSDPSASLDLTPAVTGGNGGGGAIAYGGENGTPSISDMVTDGKTTEIKGFSSGNAGGIGGAGGLGGSANLGFDNIAIGAFGAPLGGSSTISSKAIGGAGGYGGGGANGGNAGRNWTYYDSPFYAPPAVPYLITEGGIGGNGGLGQGGGGGGTATNAVSNLQEFVTGAAVIDLSATGGDGGAGGEGGPGGGGAEASAGANGGAGAAGAQATAEVSGSAITDAKSIALTLTATGGDGGVGGAGGNPGFGVDRGTGGYELAGQYTPFTLNGYFGPAGNGGAGGDGATGTADLTDTTLTAPVVSVTLTAIGGFGQVGGTPGGPEAFAPPISTYPPGQTVLKDGDIINIYTNPDATKGANGTSASGQLTFTGNTIAAAATLSLVLHVVDPSGTTDFEPLDGAAGGNLVFSSNSLIGGGNATLDVSGAGANATVDDKAGSISIAGSPGNVMTGFSNYILADGDSFIRGTSPTAVVFVAPDADTIVFSPGHGATVLDDTTSTNTILSFQGYGASLDFSKITADTTSEAGNVVINIPGDGAITLSSSTWAPSAENTTLPCFLKGTRIATNRGEVAVEQLAIGDPVLTIAGEHSPIVWIGHRRVVCRNHPRPEKILPVRILAGAFGKRKPHRDLYLSPDHAVFAEGVLIPIRQLINGTTIAQIAAAEVTYYHLELASHDVVLAEGLPAETYLDTANRDCFDNGGTLRLHPDFEPAPFADVAWEALRCARLAVVGPELDRVRQKLLNIAGTFRWRGPIRRGGHAMS